MRLYSRATGRASLPFILLLFHFARTANGREAITTAWKNGAWHENVQNVVERSNIILERPNLKPDQAMPLGNGCLGLAIWAENGMTMQLNRADTLPARLSPGQVVIPALAKLTSAADYRARLNLYSGEFVEHGGGLSATVYVEPDSDVAVVNISGADPATVETIELNLWQPRKPRVEARGAVGVLSETWIDSADSGATGKTFGSLAAVTVVGRDVRAAADGDLAVKISFRPQTDGSFRVLIASPEWHGGDALATARKLFDIERTATLAGHRQWWNAFWSKTGLMKLHSAGGTAEYFENLRHIDLFLTAAESRGSLPGGQAGIADLFSSLRDSHRWDPSAYWHFNLRMQVAANLGAGLFDLNEPYFRLYRENLPAIEGWTRSRMEDRPGACVPETMRFNGQGFENEAWIKTPGRNCDVGSPPYYNARTLSTGAEVSLWIWQQYLATDDAAFLRENYPVMAASTRFLLAYSRIGPDGKIHTFPTNAHENQWDVHDSTNDIAAIRALLPAFVAAARTLHKDPDLVAKARAAILKLLDFPRTDADTLKQQLTPEDDAKGQDVVAQSYDQSAPIHNTENVGLEPVWPYSLVGDGGRWHDLEARTYDHRPNPLKNDWNFDPIQAARLGLASEVRSDLLALTEQYQAYPSGLASFAGPEFYIEQIGVLTTALQEALAQDYDGLLRIAPAWPKDWDVDGTVFIQHHSKVHVLMRAGQPVTIALEAGFSGKMKVRNPWPLAAVQVIAGDSGKLLQTGSGAIITIPVTAGKSYLIEQSGALAAKLPFAEISGLAATRPKTLGTRTIGLMRAKP